VEIPAIPEHEERLQRSLPVWRAEGLDFLNLHQLRLTPHNRRQLMARGYSFLPGPRVTVLESELCALRLLRWAGECGLGLPINYCSFPYKQRYQAQAARRRLAPLVREAWEEVTPTGFLRSLALRGSPELLAAAAAALEAATALHGSWELRSSEERLLVPVQALELPATRGLEQQISYVEPVLREHISYRHAFRELALDTGRRLWIERRWAARDLCGPWSERSELHRPWEHPEPGLLPYLSVEADHGEPLGSRG
jgi:hypothetical protein